MISDLIEMFQYIVKRKKACKIIIHFGPGFINKIETNETFKPHEWKKNLK